MCRTPDIDICCGCITDLKTAAAIIATLAIVTSPVLSWSIVRHSYVIRVSCTMTMKTSKSDVINYNLYNVLSFGFGANAGVEPSCLRPISSGNKSDKIDNRRTFERPKDEKNQEASSDALPMLNSYEIFSTNAKPDSKRGKFVIIATYLGWVVVLADIAFVVTSIFFMMGLYRPSRTDHYTMTKIFLVTGIVSVILSFIYGFLYVSTCILVGGGFPLCEFILILIDLLVWVYFFLIINTYRKRQKKNRPPMAGQIQLQEQPFRIEEE